METHRLKIEKHSAVLERIGFSPVASRLYLFLLFAKQNEATFEELIDYFGVSKSAVSNGLKFLQTVNLILPITKNGKRKRYFKVDLEGNTGVAHAIARLQEMKGMLENIAKARGVVKEDDDLQKLIRYYKMMLIEYPAILEKWRRSVK
ncbi:MAG: ArsR family transcriptional regulator [Chryseolinea sp.]